MGRCRKQHDGTPTKIASTLDVEKRSSWSSWENICRQKSHKNLSGKFVEIRTKILRIPKNFLALILLLEDVQAVQTKKLFMLSYSLFFVFLTTKCKVIICIVFKTLIFIKSKCCLKPKGQCVTDSEICPHALNH